MNWGTVINPWKMVVAITGARCSTTAATESWRPECPICWKNVRGSLEQHQASSTTCLEWQAKCKGTGRGASTAPSRPDRVPCKRCGKSIAGTLWSQFQHYQSMHPARMHELDVPDDWLEGGRFDGRPQLRSRGRSRRSGSRSKVRTDADARSPSRSRRMATPVRVKKEKSPTSEPQDQKRDNEQPQHQRRHRRKQRSPSPPVDHKPLQWWS